LDKKKRKIVILELGEESNLENIEEEEYMIKELQEKVWHLEQKPMFEELRNFASLTFR